MVSGELEVLTADRDAAKAAAASDTLRVVQEVLAQFVGETAGARPDTIPPDSRLTDYATNSVEMLQIHARLEDSLHTEIAASALFDHPTVEALANHLDGCR